MQPWDVWDVWQTLAKTNFFSAITRSFALLSIDLLVVATCRVVITTSTAVSPYWSRNDPIYQVIFSTVLVPYKMHAESWELDLNSEFRVLTSWISLTLSSTIQNACNNKNDLKVGIDFQCSMNMVPKCRAQFMHDWIPAVLSARTRDCRRRPDLIARAENHNSTQPGCHVASRTRSTDLQKMTWYFRSFPVRGYCMNCKFYAQFYRTFYKSAYWT